MDYKELMNLVKEKRIKSLEVLQQEAKMDKIDILEEFQTHVPEYEEMKRMMTINSRNY